MFWLRCQLEETQPCRLSNLPRGVDTSPPSALGYELNELVELLLAAGNRVIVRWRFDIRREQVVAVTPSVLSDCRGKNSQLVHVANGTHPLAEQCMGREKRARCTSRGACITCSCRPRSVLANAILQFTTSLKQLSGMYETNNTK